jgi:hypothetical protein
VVADDGTIDGGDIIIKLVGATTISVVAGDVVIAS